MSHSTDANAALISLLSSGEEESTDTRISALLREVAGEVLAIGREEDPATRVVLISLLQVLGETRMLSAGRTHEEISDMVSEPEPDEYAEYAEGAYYFQTKDPKGEGTEPRWVETGDVWISPDSPGLVKIWNQASGKWDETWAKA